MPRAFLITNKRYNSCVDHEDAEKPHHRGAAARENSPERRVSTAEAPAEPDVDSSVTDSTLDEGDPCWPSWKPASPRSPASLSRTSGIGAEEPLSLTVHDVPQQSTASVSILAAVLQQVRTLQVKPFQDFQSGQVGQWCGHLSDA